MSATLREPPAFLAEPSYFPRVTRRDGRAIEAALAGPTLFDSGVQLRAAVVEATYAATDPPLLKRLREQHIPQVVDPQTLRFTGWRFLETAAFEALPYVPNEPLQPETFSDEDAKSLARDVMLFQQDRSAAAYLAAGVPYYDTDLQAWIRHNDRLLSASCRANGGRDLDRRPLIAQVAPGRMALARPELIINRLIDHPIDAVYVQALRLDPVKDGLEKLVEFAYFLGAIRAETGLPVIASRVGAFGLVLQALGIDAFDSGLGQAEATNLADLNRPQTKRERSRKRRGGPDRRVYFEALKTTLQGRHAAAIVANPGLRARLVCALGCCQHRGFEDLAARRRQHYLWVREHEVDQLRSRPTPGLRRDFVHEQLRDAVETGRHVRRVLLDSEVGVPTFEHLERWIAVLARESSIPAIA